MKGTGACNTRGNITLDNVLSSNSEADNNSDNLEIDNSIYFDGQHNVFKYPRTPHLPWSKGTSDDIVLNSLDHFKDKEIVVTEKMDGENFSLYNKYCHARSLDSADHTPTLKQSRTWVYKKWAEIKYNIPDGWRICGENMFARHKIEYNDLSGYFLVFAIFNEKNKALSWDDTLEYAEMLNLNTVQELNRGVYNEDKLKELTKYILDNNKEGYVIRNINSYNYDTFKFNVAKYVAPSFHVNEQHWSKDTFIKNELNENNL